MKYSHTISYRTLCQVHTPGNQRYNTGAVGWYWGTPVSWPCPSRLLRKLGHSGWSQDIFYSIYIMPSCYTFQLYTCMCVYVPMQLWTSMHGYTYNTYIYVKREGGDNVCCLVVASCTRSSQAVSK